MNQNECVATITPGHSGQKKSLNVGANLNSELITRLHNSCTFVTQCMTKETGVFGPTGQIQGLKIMKRQCFDHPTFQFI